MTETVCPTCGFYPDTAPHEYGCAKGRVHLERAALVAWLRENGIESRNVVKGSVKATSSRIYYDEFPSGQRKWRPLKVEPPEGLVTDGE